MLDFLATLLVGAVTFAFVYAIAFAVSIYYAWAISILWDWFVVPMGAPHLGVMHIVGLSLVIGMFMHGIAKVQVEGEKVKGTILGVLIAPLLTLLFGYIVHSLGG